MPVAVASRDCDGVSIFLEEECRFVAFRVVPRSVDDIIREFNRQQLRFSEELDPNVEDDAFSIPALEVGPYVYSGIAYRQSDNPFDWVPIGLYEENSGIFQIRPGESTQIHINVDFNNLPPFPPVSN